MRGKQEIECQGALFAPDGGLRVSLKGDRKTERKRDRGKDNKTGESEKKEEREREGGRYRDNKKQREYRCRDTKKRIERPSHIKGGWRGGGV